MTTPGGPGLTAESEALIADYHGRMHEDDCECDAAFIRDPLRAIEAAAVARHVRETGCDGHVERLARYLHDERIKVGTCGDPWSGEGWDDHIGWHEAEARRILAPTVAASEEVPWKHYGVQPGCTHECHYTGWNTSGECCAECWVEPAPSPATEDER